MARAPAAARSDVAWEEAAAWDTARELLQTCVWLYESQPTQLGPEHVLFATAEGVALDELEASRRATDGLPSLAPSIDDIVSADRSWRGRPEILE